MSTSLAAAEAEARTLQAEIDSLLVEKADAMAAARKFAAGATADDDLTEVDGKFMAADKIGEEAARKQSELNAALTEHVAAMRTELSKASNTAPTSLGHRFVGDEAYTEKHAAGLLGMQDARGELPRVQVASADETEMWLASTDGGALVPTDERLGGVQLPQRALRLLDLITVGSTQSDQVEVLKQTIRNNQVENIAHASPGTPAGADPVNDATGVPTPQSEYVWERATYPVRRMGHHSIQPRSTLADAPRLRTLINNELTYGLRKHTEDQVLSGDGTGQNLTGLLNQAGISDQAHSDAGSDFIADSLHKAMTLVRVAFEDDITGIVMHPTDWQDYVLTRDGANEGYLGGVSPFQGAPSTAWGYSVVVTTAIPAGTILAGRFSEATLYVRQGIEIMSGYIDDQMIKDLTTINAEYRAAFGLERPSAFATVTRGA